MVHEALEITLCSGTSSRWLTPITTVMSAPSAGAETITRFAPASTCFAAAARLVKIPVHSSTMSMPRLRQGSCTGSAFRADYDPAATDIDPIIPSRDLTGEMAVDAVISEEIRIGCDRAEVVDHTISTFSQRVSCKARRTNRPMRPKPLMATRTVMSHLLSTFMPTLRRSATSRLDLFCLSRHPGEKTGGTFAD